MKCKFAMIKAHKNLPAIRSMQEYEDDDVT